MIINDYRAFGYKLKNAKPSPAKNDETQGRKAMAAIPAY